MIYTETPLQGSYVISLEKREDERGFFARLFCANEFENKGLVSQWVQVNNSLSKDVGTLRGLHFQQKPFQEVKLVRCIQGSVWDVIVDLRPESETFGKWFAAELNSENRNMMYVPAGFAHGFITLQPNSEVIYMVSEFYTPGAEGCLLWNDSDININWPLQPQVISEKDKVGMLFNNLKSKLQ